jgi:heme/copper-type cytochrome/quinol oxidase subunit 4
METENQDPPKEVEQAEVPENKDEKADGEKDKEEKKNLVPKVPNPFEEKPYVPTIVSDADAYNLSPCCCCLCACSHDRVGYATCFGCLPIRCGIMFIAIQIFLLAIVLITVTFFQLLNEYLPWWYVFITLLLLIPIAIAASQMVYFFAKDNRSTRGNLFGAVVLSIIAISLWCVW